MSTYMTEAEQLEAIKNWWTRNQRWVSTLITVILLLVAGYRYWTWHTEKVTHDASEAYEQLMTAASNQEGDALQAYAKALIKAHPNTVYGDAARLALAKYWVNQQQWTEAAALLDRVMHHAKMPAMREIASIRLVRLWISEKQYDKALDALNGTHMAAYSALISELKGDIYAAQGQYAEAQTAYREAHEEVKLRGIGHVFLDMKSTELAAATGVAQAA